MIFRRLYKRCVTRLFGGYVTEQAINETFDPLSEWESFKLLLPRAVSRLFFPTAMSQTDGLRAVQKMIGDALRDAPDAPG
jgi:hypothetical protein